MTCGSPTIASSRKMSYESVADGQTRARTEAVESHGFEATLRLRDRRHCGRRRRHEARGRRRRATTARSSRGSTRRPRSTSTPTRSSRRSTGLVDRARRARARSRWASAAAARWTRGGEHVSPLNIPAWRDFPLRARLAAHTGLPGVGRQRRQGARARRRLDRRGRRRGATTSAWSCRPASAAASCSTAGCSTAPTATPATSAT